MRPPKGANFKLWEKKIYVKHGGAFAPFYFKMENVTQSEFARRVGKSPTEIKRWIDTGKITEKMLTVIKGKQLIKFELAIDKLNISANKPQYSPKSVITSEKPPRGAAKKIQKRSAEPIVKFEDTGDAYRNAEIREKTAKAEIAEMNLEKARGELVPTNEVYKQLFEFGQRLRKDIDSVPEKIVDELLASASREEAIIILREAYRDALRSLATAEDIKFTENGTE